MRNIQKLLLLSLTAYSGQCLAQSDACEQLESWQSSQVDLQVSETQYFPDGSTPASPFGPPQSLPPHCHVEGSFEHRTGADGKDYAINFAINLPDDWNGRYLFQGGGGLNGSVNPPVGAQAAGDMSALSRGYAVVSNDSGHTGGGFDASFMSDQQAMLNFYYQANAKVVKLSRPMVESYYQEDVHHSYFVGCSTGGREGMIMAQRFPDLFDGIVTGAPAIRTGLSNLALRWITDQMKQDEYSSAADFLSEQEESLVMNALMQSCDALDGQEDGLIFNRASCSFDPNELACSSSDSNICLNDNKAAALAKAMSGPVDSRGIQVYPGFWFDSGIDDAGFLQGLLVAGGNPPVPPPATGSRRQDVNAEFVIATATDEILGNSTQYNISTFITNGSKQIFYHGVSDAWFSAQDTLEYFENMGATNAQFMSQDEYSKLYLVPGMAHCQGGEQTLDSFDMLAPLVEWVENGTSPEPIIATGLSMPGESRPLCPWPEYAHFNGIGNASDAENYSCKTPSI